MQKRSAAARRLHIVFSVGAAVVIVALLRAADPGSTVTSTALRGDLEVHGGNNSREIARFDAHIASIEAVVASQYQRVLGPWKTNQNVSVDVLDNGFGDAMLRVICLQQVLQTPNSDGSKCTSPGLIADCTLQFSSVATPGIMQVGVRLKGYRRYRLLHQGCRVKPTSETSNHSNESLDQAPSASAFRACAFVDAVRSTGREGGQNIIVWDCAKVRYEERARERRRATGGSIGE
jgi:hypothetical protein